MGCVFCATGQMGFRRHLSVEEIVAQVHYVEREVRRRHDDRIRNIVLMGMGEALHNFEGSIHALEILTDTRGINIGPQRVTISTVGHVPGILRLARHPKRYNLVVSLHGSTDEERQASRTSPRGHFRLTGTMACRSSSVLPCRLTTRL